MPDKLIVCCVFLSFLTSGHAQDANEEDDERADLKKIYLQPQTGAVCNDNSTAAFYYSPPLRTSDKWLVYLEGNSFCTNGVTCSTRQQSWTTSSSSVYPDTLEGTDLFSEEPDKTPFSDFHHVYIPYCSSDMFLADRIEPVRLTNDQLFYFRGERIVRSILEELERRGLKNESQLVLAGSSTGGIGALNHAIRLRHQGKFPKLAVLVDSSWLIDHDGIMSELYEELVYGEDIHRAFWTCSQRAADRFSLPCCMSTPCLAEKFITSLGLPMFLLTTASDFFVVSSLLSRTDTHPDFSIAGERRELFHLQVELYSGTMNSSISRLLPRSVSLFQSGCGQHALFRNIPLWGSSLTSDGNPLTIRTETVELEYSYRHTPGYWNDVTASDVTLLTALSHWVASNYSSSTQWESCSGFICNPTCPDTLKLGLSTIDIPGAIEVIFLSLAVLFFATAVIFKTYLMLRARIIHGYFWEVYEAGTSQETVGSSFGSNSLLRTAALSLQRRIEGTPWMRRESLKLLYKATEGDELQLACKYLSVTVPLNSAAIREHHGSSPSLGGFLPWRQSHKEAYPRTKKILDDVTVHFYSNCLVGIMGPSGCGKTTFLNVLANRVKGYDVKVRPDSCSRMQQCTATIRVVLVRGSRTASCNYCFVIF